MRRFNAVAVQDFYGGGWGHSISVRFLGRHRRSRVNQILSSLAQSCAVDDDGRWHPTKASHAAIESASVRGASSSAARYVHVVISASPAVGAFPNTTHNSLFFHNSSLQFWRSWYWFMPRCPTHTKNRFVSFGVAKIAETLNAGGFRRQNCCCHRVSRWAVLYTPSSELLRFKQVN